MSLPQKTKFDPAFAVADKVGNPTQFFRDYMTKCDAVVAALAAGGAPNNLVNAVNDVAAAAGGVAVGNMYRNGSILMVRVV